MSFISWTDDLSVHIPSVGAQHKTIVGILNDLHDSMRVGKANGVMRKILGDPADYTVTHFSYEERLFKQHAYPDAAAHRSSHASLVTQLRELQKQLEGGASISIKTFGFLKKWLTEHIMQDDRKYSQFLRASGVR